MEVFKSLKRPFFILAPMDDVTDTVFRQIIASTCGADIYFTEFVNVDGLQSPGRDKLLKKLTFVSSEKKLIAQIWGRNPDNFYLTARQIADGTFAQELGLSKEANYIGVDLNMGCPQKSEINGGTCAALINNRSLAIEIIQATKEGLNNQLPISVKTRLGFNEIDLTWPELLLKQELNMLTMHGRTKREKSRVPAHWEAIGETRKLRDKINPDTLIIGNGDVKNYAHGLQLAEKYKLDGIMIGRGIFNDPYAFSKTSQWAKYSKREKILLYLKHVELFNLTWKNDERPIHVLNKYCKIYINGFEGAKELREKLMNTENITNLVQALKSEANQ